MGGPGSRVAMDRKTLIKTLWPDKALYGAILLLITGVLGLSYAVAALSGLEITFGRSVPGWITGFPAWATLLFSSLTALLALVSLTERRLAFAVAGTVSGFVSFGLAGLASLLSLAAGWMLWLAHREREDTNPATRALTASMWPDKTLAASLLMLVAGVVTLGWGAGIASGYVVFRGYLDSAVVFGSLAAGAGAVCLAASYRLYWQRSPALAAVASVLAILGMALYVVGPLTGFAALVLVVLALREDEFEEERAGEKADDDAEASEAP